MSSAHNVVRAFESARWMRAGLLAATAWLASVSVLAAGERSQELVNQLPRTANAVLILDMEKAKRSPLGVREGWQGKIEKAFEAGLLRVPPQATHFVLAAQLDFEFLEPMWEAAVSDLEAKLSLQQLAKSHGDAADTIEGLAAISLPNDTCLVQFSPKTLGAMAPANRQLVARWLAEVRRSPLPPLSAYLQGAAAISDKNDTEMVLAVDLDGAVSPAAVAKYLKTKEQSLKQWKTDAQTLGKLLGGVSGVRVEVQIGDQPKGRITVDFKADAAALVPFAKEFLLEFLGDVGAAVEDLQSWTPGSGKNAVWLQGTLSPAGLRRLFSLVDAPPVEQALAPAAESGPRAAPTLQVESSRQHFRSVTGMFNELKRDIRNSKSLSSNSLFFDKYARRIEKLPILNVDGELLEYSAFVAHSLRKASGMVRTMGIQSGARQAQIVSAPTGYAYTAYGDGAAYTCRYGRYGAYGTGGVYAGDKAEMKAVEAQRRVVRAEEKAKMATNVYEVRDAVIAATTDVRRKMTQKYQVEF